MHSGLVSVLTIKFCIWAHYVFLEIWAFQVVFNKGVPIYI